MTIRIGTSGYNYPEWRGSFYPEKFATSKMLPYYAERFSTVEINYTFYRMPNAKTVASWDAETPSGFCFALKAPQRITHVLRLKDVDDPLRYFLDTARTLGPKLGPILFQLPPNFKKDLVAAGRPPRAAARRSALRVRVPPRELARRRSLRAARATERRAVHRRQREGHHTAGGHRRLRVPETAR